MTEISKIVHLPISDDMAHSAADAAKFLKALAHKQRLMILCHLCSGEKYVGQLMEQLGMSQSATSQMLARLRDEGIVNTRRDGKMIFYRLATEGTAELVGLLHTLFCENPKSSSDLPGRHLLPKTHDLLASRRIEIL